MYGSFGSYSSMSIGSAPMNISTSVTSRDESCAYPSWPRRSSLSSSDSDASYEPRASSYLSDDDLFLYDEPSSDSDDSRSVSSAGSASPPTLGLVLASPVRQAPSEAEMLEMQRQRLNMRKDLIRMVQQEKERRKQASKGRRSSSKKSSSKTRGYTMAPITEADE
ncbi:hypothetical protein PWT90_06393 [Aphanocladium album]|nr:hypothetical protein PWT90_06393 [Aphanocladium album]